MSQCQVQRIRKRYEETRDVFDKPRSGRPRKTTAREDRLLARKSKACPFSTAAELHEIWSPEVPVSTRTVCRILSRNGLHGRISAQKPALNKRQLKNRVAFAKAHSLPKGWTLEKWQKVDFSDESSVELHQSPQILQETYSPFPPNKLWFLNRFRSGFLEPWCYLANQPAFPPVLSGTIVMKDASSTEGVAQCTLNLENDTPTDVITVRKENLLFFASWEPTFRVPNQFIFGRNAPNGSKLGARTGTEPVPCWWKRATSGARMDPRFTQKTVKFGGGKIMVWGYIQYGVCERSAGWKATSIV